MGSTRLLHDIHSTYKWLNDHATEARLALLLHWDDKIFLNLPENDLGAVQTWIWTSVRQLVFNISYDTNDLVAVGGFLNQFQPLLQAAGVKAILDSSYTSRPAGQHNHISQIRAVYNDMREAGELTDVILEPTVGIGESAMEELRAHKSFLAATVPHLRVALLSGMEESNSEKYPFEGSMFGARAVLGKNKNPVNSSIFSTNRFVQNLSTRVTLKLKSFRALRMQWIFYVTSWNCWTPPVHGTGKSSSRKLGGSSQANTS
jgi:hypothetical protein